MEPFSRNIKEIKIFRVQKRCNVIFVFPILISTLIFISKRFNMFCNMKYFPRGWGRLAKYEEGFRMVLPVGSLSHAIERLSTFPRLESRITTSNRNSQLFLQLVFPLINTK